MRTWARAALIKTEFGKAWLRKRLLKLTENDVRQVLKTALAGGSDGTAKPPGSVAVAPSADPYPSYAEPEALTARGIADVVQAFADAASRAAVAGTSAS